MKNLTQLKKTKKDTQPKESVTSRHKAKLNKPSNNEFNEDIGISPFRDLQDVGWL